MENVLKQLASVKFAQSVMMKKMDTAFALDMHLLILIVQKATF